MNKEQREILVDALCSLRERINKLGGLKNTLSSEEFREDLLGKGLEDLNGVFQGMKQALNEFEQAQSSKTKEVFDSMKKTHSMDAIEKSVLKDIADRNQLAEKLHYHGFSCDHSSMNCKELAAHACKKLGVKCPNGQEYAALSAYLTGIQSGYSQDGALCVDGPSKPSKALENYLNGETSSNKNFAIKKYLGG